jgi:hypothetical protein
MITLSPYRKPQGRKAKLLDSERVTRLENALKAGNTIRNACALAGVSDKSYYRWLKEAEAAPMGHPLREFRDTVKRAKAIAEDRCVRIIQNAAKTNWQAAAWWLERRIPIHWGRK